MGDEIPPQSTAVPLISLAIPFGVAEEFCVETGPQQTLFSQSVGEFNEEAPFTFMNGPTCIDVPLPPMPVVFLDLDAAPVGDLLPLPHITLLFSSVAPINGFEVHYKFLPVDLPASDIIVLDGNILQVWL